MTPKIIQIAVSGDKTADTLFVLQDDGTLWFSRFQHISLTHWQRIPAPAESEAELAAAQD